MKKLAAAAATKASSPKYIAINLLSTRLYNIDTSDVNIIGRDSLNRFIAIGPSSILILLFFFTLSLLS